MSLYGLVFLGFLVLVAILLILLCLIRVTRFIHDPLEVFLDLDRTLIKSELIVTEGGHIDAKLPPAQFPGSFDHIDDDFDFEDGVPNSRTWFRPFTRLLLFWLQYILRANVYVYTSAQETYTDNIRNAMTEFGYPTSYVKRWLTRSVFPRRYLRRNGKDLRFMLWSDEDLRRLAIVGEPDTPKEELELFLRRGVLVDDQKDYLQAQPENGILIPEWKDVKAQWRDWTLLRLILVLTFCSLFRDVRGTLPHIKGFVERVNKEKTES